MATNTPVICKGTHLDIWAESASAYTAVAQVLSIDLPEVEVETFECDYLANTGVGIPYMTTNRVEGGKCSGEIWLDPTGASTGNHYSLYQLMTTPNLNLPSANTSPSSTSQIAWQVVFTSVGSSPYPAWQFYGAGFSLGATVALKEGLKGKFSIKLSGIPVFSTTAST